MRYDGVLAEWNDARGFGWVQADAGGERVFVHISAFQPRPGPQQRPHTGMRLAFSVGIEGGKKRAQQVEWQAQALRTSRPARSSRPGAARKPAASALHGASRAGSGRFGYGVLLAFAALCAFLVLARGLPWQVLAVYGLLSLVCLGVYAHDKHQAQTGQWRTPESTLQSLALLGGWPGALLAQQWLRHKSSKAAFRRVFWGTVCLNVAGLLWWAGSGSRLGWLGV